MSVPDHPIASLKMMLRAHLLADADVASAIGLSIFDAPPRGTSPPYVHFGDAVARDNGTVEREGAIIEIDLVALTSERGTAEALMLASALGRALGQPLPALAGHRLVALEHRQTTAQHDAAASLTRATVRLRAFTEAL
jgi:hypothetical protein